MHFCLIGYGKMGQMVETIAKKKGHDVVGKINTQSQSKDIEKILIKSDVCIDFSHPDAILRNLKMAADFGKNFVMGTTGWASKLEEVKAIVDSSKIGFLYSPNFSIGIALYLRIVKNAASLINSFEEYDVGGMEIHHHEKYDSPSGTAEAIGETLLSQLTTKKQVVFTPTSNPRKKDEIQFSSLRLGSEPGTHSVIFDSVVDSVTLTHRARNREGFAAGALKAAEWLKGKEGFFTFDDFINSYFIPADKS